MCISNTPMSCFRFISCGALLCMLFELGWQSGPPQRSNVGGEQACRIFLAWHIWHLAILAIECCGTGEWASPGTFGPHNWDTSVSRRTGTIERFVADSRNKSQGLLLTRTPRKDRTLLLQTARFEAQRAPSQWRVEPLKYLCAGNQLPMMVHTLGIGREVIYTRSLETL